LKKERVFFFRGSAREVSGQCGGAKCGLGFAKTIFAGGKDLLCLGSFSKRRGFSIRRGGAGGMRGGFFNTLK